MTAYEKYCEEHRLCKWCEWEKADENGFPPEYNETDLTSFHLDLGALSGMDCYTGIESIDDETYLYMGALDSDYANLIFKAGVRINYCPMCGRKLTKGDEK